MQHYNVAPVRTGGPHQAWASVNPQQNWNRGGQGPPNPGWNNQGPSNSGWNGANTAGAIPPAYEREPPRQNRTFRGHGQRTSETAVAQNGRFEPVRYA